MKKILFFLILLLLLFPSYINALESYCVIDAKTNRVLEEKNKDKPYLMASTTKVMTSIIALENASLNDVLVAGEEILDVYGSSIYLDVGENMTLKDLLYGLLLQSGNDAASVIAENTLGYDKFIQKMNEKAISLGLKNTTFSNPHGLDDTTKNYSSAYDLSLILSYAMKNKEFRKITKTKKYKSISDKEEHIWYNKNELLSKYKYATGGKIGYTGNAGYTFVSSSSKAGEDVIISSFKDKNRFETHKKLYENIFKKYDSYEILNKYTFSLKDKNYKDYHLFIKNNLEIMLTPSERKNIKLNIVLSKNINHDNSVGSINVLLKDNKIYSLPIYGVKKKSKLIKIKNWLCFFCK
ncbi:MAG: serine hydrolase [Bacilli bacterium]